jgi:hypothetical protein
MVISHNSQLGLRFQDPTVKIDFLTLMKEHIEALRGFNEQQLKVVQNQIEGLLSTEEELELYEELKKDSNLINSIADDDKIREATSPSLFGDKKYDLMNDSDFRQFFICPSVYKAAELIKVTSGFTGRTLKDIKIGKYSYLLGKNEMVRFACKVGYIRGFYYNSKDRIAFDWGVQMSDGKYYFGGKYQKEFTKIMQVLTFVELGDIEVIELLGGRNNGGKKNIDKITNTSEYTVFVVDSSWNKLIIRTEGFAVRGHYRLQPCGDGHLDRRLIWISAFEKHGYKRRPRAEIVRT